MEEPIQDILQVAPLWERLLTPLASLLGGALAVIAGILLERRRSTRVHRREHLRDIQDKVFRPLQQKIRKYHLPILKLTTSNIELQDQDNPIAVTEATDYSWERREQLGIIGPDLSVLDVPSDALYDCSKQVHYPELINQYEALEADINDYNSQCIEYIQSLADYIVLSTGIRRHPMVYTDEATPWVRAEALALHIYKRQQDLERYGVSSSTPSKDSEATGRVELPGGSAAVYGAKLAEVEEVLKLVTELENRREQLNQLHCRAATLRQIAIDLSKNLEWLLHTSSLNGKCDLQRE